MSYIALARKWRPRTFSQMIGQDHVSQALIHSLDEQRLHHAYIFTGTRGVGKTSIARLFAKALNCEQGISAEPCLQCDACIAIEQGRFLDLIEIDAASKTGVEDTRQLLDNAQYLPTQGRFKIYLIDEVHMLSQSSFNALLKTLEEPPAHVKFFLATTDPQKIPVTVLSRCLQFSLRAISEKDIAEQLIHILTEESISFERSAIDVIARAAHGSMRDGLSLLDQALAIGNQQVTSITTQNMLGYTHQDYALYLLRALADNNSKELLTLAAKIGQEGGHYSYVTEQLLQYLHQMMIYQQVGNMNGISSLSDQLAALANHWSAEDLQLFYQILLHGQEELSLAPMPAIGFDVMLIRLLQFEPVAKQAQPARIAIAETGSISMPVNRQEKLQQSRDNNDNMCQLTKTDSGIVAENLSERQNTELAPDDRANIAEAILSESPDVLAEKNLADDVNQKASSTGSLVTKNQTEGVEQVDGDSQDWVTIVANLDMAGMAKTALEHTSLKTIENNTVYLVTHGGHLSLFIPSIRERITKSLSSYFKCPMKLQIEEVSEVTNTPAKVKNQRQEEDKKKAVDAIESDPVVQQIKDDFSASVLENSIIFRSDEL